MAKLTYDDFKQRLNIQEVLVDAGYTLNRRDGLRYPSYVRLDSTGILSVTAYSITLLKIGKQKL